MSWRERMQKGSFRGVPFLAESHEAEDGRRVATHQFPLRDTPWAEDLGRKADRWTLELYVIGPDYMASRDALRAALREKGPGTLVHPWLGSRAVQVESSRLRESTREGGLAKFTVAFVEAGAQAQPAAGRDTAWAVSRDAGTTNARAAEDFPRSFDCQGMPEYVRTAAAERLLSILDAARAVTSSLSGASGVGPYLSSVDALESRASALVLAPRLLAPEVQGLATGLSAAAPDRGSAYAACRQLLALVPARAAVPAVPTASRIQEAANANALTALARRSALAEAARALGRMDFATYDDARAARDAMAEDIDAEAATASDPMFAALTDLRVAVIRDLNARGANLARLASWTSPATLPALVVAHRVYGDATRAGEIVDRNRVRHPGAVPGGHPLEVLTRA